MAGGVIEFRGCRFGGGDSGARATQVVADLTGARVTAPIDEIKSLGLVGGLAATWRTTWPTASVIAAVVSWFRDAAARIPWTTHPPASLAIAPATAQYVPLRGAPAPPMAPPPGTPAPTVVATRPPVPAAAKAGAGLTTAVVIAALAAVVGVGRGTPRSAAPSAAVTAVPAAATAATASPCTGPEIKLFDNWTGNAVVNGGASPTISTGAQTYCRVAIATCHCNGGKGAAPAGTLALVGRSGRLGPYQAQATAGQAANVNRVAMVPTTPVVINGTDTVQDSPPGTWSRDSNGGAAFVRVWVQGYTGGKG
jgi:hypothetical protein